MRPLSIHKLAVEIDDKNHLLISWSLGDDLAVRRGDKGPSPELQPLPSCRSHRILMANTVHAADITAVS